MVQLLGFIYLNYFIMSQHIKTILKSIFVVFSTLLFTKALQAQDDKAVAIKSAIESNSFIFKPQFVTPLGDRSRIVTAEYDMWVSKDTVKTYLPYFGRAYSATIGQSGGGGVMFTSTDFDYAVKEKKGGGWNILIKPKDTNDVRQLFLNIGDEGNASLHITSNNRQAITFSGYVAAR